MHKSLTSILIFLIFFGACARPAFAWNDHPGSRVARLKLQIDSLPSGTPVKVRLKDRRQIKGTLVAHSEEGFQLDTPELVEVSYSAVKAIDELANQVSTGSTPGRPAKHHHFVRTVLIGLGAMCAFAVIVAVADK